MSTRQNNVRIFGIIILPSTKRKTNKQTDTKHEMGKTLSSMSMLKLVDEKNPPFQLCSAKKQKHQKRRCSRKQIETQRCEIYMNAF